MTGYFDPLLASHARRLEEIAQGPGSLFVAICEPAEPVLAARARAELAAGLAVVDCVIIPEAPLPLVRERLAPDAEFSEEAADEGRRRELIALVRSRCG